MIRCLRCGAEMLHTGTEERNGKRIIEVYKCKRCGDVIRENTEEEWVKP